MTTDVRIVEDSQRMGDGCSHHKVKSGDRWVYKGRKMIGLGCKKSCRKDVVVRIW